MESLSVPGKGQATASPKDGGEHITLSDLCAIFPLLRGQIEGSPPDSYALIPSPCGGWLGIVRRKNYVSEALLLKQGSIDIILPLPETSSIVFSWCGRFCTTSPQRPAKSPIKAHAGCLPHLLRLGDEIGEIDIPNNLLMDPRSWSGPKTVTNHVVPIPMGPVDDAPLLLACGYRVGAGDAADYRIGLARGEPERFHPWSGAEEST